jgi:hypothetical protein
VEKNLMLTSNSKIYVCEKFQFTIADESSSIRVKKKGNFDIDQGNVMNCADEIVKGIQRQREKSASMHLTLMIQIKCSTFSIYGY